MKLMSIIIASLLLLIPAPLLLLVYTPRSAGFVWGAIMIIEIIGMWMYSKIKYTPDGESC